MDPRKTCPMCGAMLGSDTNRCPSCGESFQPHARKRKWPRIPGSLVAVFIAAIAFVAAWDDWGTYRGSTGKAIFWAAALMAVVMAFRSFRQHR